MAPHIAEATAGLMMVAFVMLSTSLPAAATAEITSATATTSERRRPEAVAVTAAAGTARSPGLAWGWWDRKQRSQDQGSPRVPGVATALSDERRAVAAGYQQQVLDSSWTHAAFRAFHEMRAGRPPLSESAGGDNDGLGETGGGLGRGPLAVARRLASNLPRSGNLVVCDLLSAAGSAKKMPCRIYRRIAPDACADAQRPVAKSAAFPKIFGGCGSWPFLCWRMRHVSRYMRDPGNDSLSEQSGSLLVRPAAVLAPLSRRWRKYFPCMLRNTRCRAFRK